MKSVWRNLYTAVDYGVYEKFPISDPAYRTDEVELTVWETTHEQVFTNIFSPVLRGIDDELLLLERRPRG